MSILLSPPLGECALSSKLAFFISARYDEGAPSVELFLGAVVITSSSLLVLALAACARDKSLDSSSYSHLQTNEGRALPLRNSSEGLVIPDGECLGLLHSRSVLQQVVDEREPQK